MIIYYNNKTGRIYGAILGRVHNEFEKKPNLIRPRDVKKKDISRKILNLKDSIAIEEYLEGEQAKILDCEVVLDRDPDFLFIRKRPLVEKQKPEVVETLVVDLTKPLMDIVNNYSQTSRQGIKSANEQGLSFREVGFKEIHILHNVLEEIEDLKDIKLAKRLLTIRANFLDGIFRAYVVENKGLKPLAAALITVKGRFVYTLGGVTPEGRSSHAGDFLIHNLIMDAKELGFKEFDLGGIYADWADDEKKKVNKFKERWGGKPVPLI